MIERSYAVIMLLLVITVFMVYPVSSSVSSEPSIDSHLERVLLTYHAEAQGSNSQTSLRLSGYITRSGVGGVFTIQWNWTSPGFLVGWGLVGIDDVIRGKWRAFGTAMGYKESEGWPCGPNYELLDMDDYYFNVERLSYGYRVTAWFHHAIEITERPFCIFTEVRLDHHDNNLETVAIE